MEAAAYLAEALGHPVYERWTWQRLIQVYGALPNARRAKPRVCRLLVDAPDVVESWQRGRLLVAAGDAAPHVDAVVTALLKTQRRRFKLCTAMPEGESEAGAGFVVAGSDALQANVEASLPVSLTTWLQRTGRLYNAQRDTNTLGALDDQSALASFLRERAARSRHTWRAYSAELQRLVQWCVAQGRGPLSDLTRQDLLAYQAWLRRPGASPGQQVLSEQSQARAVAVVTSMFRYWHDTGYLLGNPAARLPGSARTRAGYTPKRFVPAELLRACDDWVALQLVADADVRIWRRAAIWTLYRVSGARLVELAWNPTAQLPRLEVGARGEWTLTVLGKGDKERMIPLPHVVDGVLRGYRQARGLPALPDRLERMPLIHGDKGGQLGARGLYEEVKAVLLAVAAVRDGTDDAGAAVLRAASPHWLRHAYARTLVVDERVPLPAAQALLGHASVQTTAAYAKTDLSQLREFVEAALGER